ncbi:transporter [Lutimonas vermicola]|uniref:Transporter n=1 Tax=Lutimonas vermicola TaxID=414288 RepID=A0ABU9L2I8_9FLAO
MKKLNVIILGIFCLSYTVSFAQKIVTDRPDQTESSSTVPKNSLQIESGMLFRYAEEGEISLREVAIPSTLFRYGISKGLEIRVVNQYVNIKEENSGKEISGITDLEVGVKIQLLKKENKNTEIAFLSHMILPTGTKEVSFEKVGTINKLSISHQLGDKVGLGYNVGYNYFGIENGFLTYSLAIGVEINERAGLYVEPYGDIGIFNEHLANIDAGFTYLLKDNFQIDFSFGTGLNYTMNYISAGFSWNIAPKEN